MAAGHGRRLGAITAAQPKALVTVGGESLLAHAVRFAARLAPAEIIVVGGAGFAQVTAEVHHRALPVTLVENPAAEGGNLLSLLAARPRLGGGGDDFLLMNVDHLYRAGIAAVVRQPVDDVTAYIDTDRPLGADDMKVARDARGRIAAIAKTLASWDCGYVGMTRVPAAAADRYWRAADETASARGPGAHVEEVLAQLAASATPPACRDISGHGWLEVDTPDERARAEAALARGDW